MDLHELRGGAGVERFLEVLLGFSGEAYDDIRGKGGIPQAIAELIELVEESSDPIPPPHTEQDFVGSALQRWMKVWAEVLSVSDQIDKIGTDFCCLDAGQTELPVSWNPVELLNQVSQSKR